jgi:hypothetical protein
MLNEKQLERINKLLSTRTFKFKGQIINDLPESMSSDIDYKFKVDGYRKMTSVGEEYDYALLNVVITGLNDRFSKLLFTPEDNEQGKMIAKSFENRLYKFYSNLNLDMTRFLRIFDENIRTTIDSLTFDIQTPLTESKMSRMSRNAVRTTVKDILNVIKDKENGEFYLPGEDGEEYSFSNLPFTYSVILYVEIDETLDGYQLNGSFTSDSDVIEILIKFNPKTLRKNIYNIIGELNDIVAHELEHGFQYINEGKVYQDPPSDSLGYYTQPDEIKSQRVGFRRVAKLRKLPFNNVVSEWFDTHRDIHGLSKNEQEIVINEILDRQW